MAELGFDGKVAIVTGAGGGLGKQHALLLARRGALVVVNDLGGAVDGSGGSATPAEQVVEEIKAAGGDAVADAHSVGTPEGGEAIVQAAIDAFGRIDIVVNNAGILRDKAFHNMDADMIEAVLAVHLKGAFYVTRPAWKHMREQGYGRVVNTSSSAGILGNFGQANYAAAKMGLVGLTNVLAIEGERYNIKANAISPIAGTRMTGEVLGKLQDLLDPALVSPVVAYLAHEDCPVSGNIYSVGGGRVVRFFIGMTEGYMKTDGPLTIEDVRDHFAEIDDTSEFTVPWQATDETFLVRDLLMPRELVVKSERDEPGIPARRERPIVKSDPSQGCATPSRSISIVFATRRWRVSSRFASATHCAYSLRCVNASLSNAAFAAVSRESARARGSGTSTGRGVSSRSMTTVTFDPTSMPAAVRTSLVSPRWVVRPYTASRERYGVPLTVPRTGGRASTEHLLRIERNLDPSTAAAIAFREHCSESLPRCTHGNAAR